MLLSFRLKQQADADMKLKYTPSPGTERLTVIASYRLRAIVSAVASGVVGLLLLGGLIAESLGSIMVYGLWH